MYDILLSSVFFLTCPEAKNFIHKIPKYEYYSEDLIQTIKESTGEYCDWDAKAD